MIIPAGYIVEVTTSENDSDNYKTEVVNGLSREEAKFIHQYCSLFNSCNYHKDPGFGNAKIRKRHDELSVLVTNMYLDHGFDPTNVPDAVHEESLDELIGWWNDGENHRVLEGITVYENPEPVELKLVKF